MATSNTTAKAKTDTDFDTQTVIRPQGSQFITDGKGQAFMASSPQGKLIMEGRKKVALDKQKERAERTKAEQKAKKEELENQLKIIQEQLKNAEAK